MNLITTFVVRRCSAVGNASNDNNMKTAENMSHFDRRRSYVFQFV